MSFLLDHYILFGTGTPGALDAPLLTNGNSFFAPVVTPGSVTLTPGLFTDGDTFFTPIVGAPPLQPALFTDADTFFAPTVAPGSVTLTPALVTNVNTFYTPIVSVPPVAFDAYSKLTGQTGANWSWLHTPVGTPRGILVEIAGTLGVDRVTALDYGGVPMTEVPLSPTLHTGTEPGSIYAFHLGSGIPPGPQTVSVTGTAGDTKNGYCFSVTSGADTSVEDTSSVTNGSLANPSVTLSLGGNSCFCAIAFLTGQNAVTGFAPTANWTARDEFDGGTACLGNYSYDIIGTADVAAGFTAAADDVALLAVAIK